MEEVRIVCQELHPAEAQEVIKITESENMQRKFPQMQKRVIMIPVKKANNLEKIETQNIIIPIIST